MTRLRSPELIQELLSVKCATCLAPKRRKKTFCGTCYHTLPVAMRHALYKRMGGGYEEARDAAVAWLKAYFAPGIAQKPFAIRMSDGRAVHADTFTEACKLAGWPEVSAISGEQLTRQLRGRS